LDTSLPSFEHVFCLCVSPTGLVTNNILFLAYADIKRTGRVGPRKIKLIIHLSMKYYRFYNGPTPNHVYFVEVGVFKYFLAKVENIFKKKKKCFGIISIAYNYNEINKNFENRKNYYLMNG
jgi:hypothetical protein